MELIDPHCKLDHEKPEVRETTHIYFSLDKLQPTIESWFKKASVEGKWPVNSVSITENWLKEGLQPRCITRDLKWGTPIPLKGWENKVFYVWFDAPIGYPSITANYMDDWRSWWQASPEQNVELYQFMGKDNVAFHSVIFPGSLLGTGDKWTMVKHISTTEYLNYEGGKFSKSRNRGVFGTDAAETGLSPSVWRYYLLSCRPETADTMFSWGDFAQRNNSELLSVLGNFVNRIIKFVVAKCNSTVPLYQIERPSSGVQSLDEKSPDDVFNKFMAEVQDLLSQYFAAMESIKLREGLRLVMTLAARGNLFLQENKFDNTLLKQEPKRCAKVIGYALNLVYLLSAVVEPYMPRTAQQILEQLNASPMFIPDTFELLILPGHRLGKPAHLFNRIADEQVEFWKQKFGSASDVEKTSKEKDSGKKKKGKQNGQDQNSDEKQSQMQGQVQTEAQ